MHNAVIWVRIMPDWLYGLLLFFSPVLIVSLITAFVVYFDVVARISGFFFNIHGWDKVAKKYPPTSKFPVNTVNCLLMIGGAFYKCKVIRKGDYLYLYFRFGRSYRKAHICLPTKELQFISRRNLKRPTPSGLSTKRVMYDFFKIGKPSIASFGIESSIFSNASAQD